MPDLLRELADAIGGPALEKLLAEFGGVHLRVPRNARPGHPIAAIIGDYAFLRLVAVFGGECLSLPKRQAVRLEQRNQGIVAERMQGESVETIARRHDLTVRSVFSILSRHRARAA
jgi:hypothetical protein